MLTIDQHGDVALVTFDRPPANALNTAFFVALEEVLARLDVPDVRAVVLTGTGRFFSAGLDLFEVFAYPEPQFAEFTRRFDTGYRALFAFPKPVVAAVNGHAIAGGAVLAGCADVRLMAAGSGRVGLTELQLGVTFPAAILEIMRYACAGRAFAEVVERALTYPPEVGAARGLVDEVVPADVLRERALAVAAELGAILPSAFAATKRTLRADALSRMNASAPGADPVWDHWRSPEVRAAVEAYRKRVVGKKA
ncbi:MAG TPA: enoyl-CoA hydratase/isomerase family protein [Candidatus Binatia bacterium]|nr:enoyl-CoA hydratase/isomerase family protein [Candidatus Binatia bacterium]